MAYTEPEPEVSTEWSPPSRNKVETLRKRLIKFLHSHALQAGLQNSFQLAYRIKYLLTSNLNEMAVEETMLSTYLIIYIGFYSGYAFSYSNIDHDGSF